MAGAAPVRATPTDETWPRPPRFRVSAAIIDLDGTLLDTAPDLVWAANAMRVDLGMAPLPAATIVSFVGKGAHKLVHRTLSGRLDGQVDAAAFDRGHDAFTRRYAERNGHEARPYDGVFEGLDRLRVLGVRLACVTNKPGAFTVPLLDAMDMARYFDVVLSGDSLPTRKPDPAPMLEAGRRLGAPPERVLAIGDSINDALAARAAGMPVLAVPYGYNEGRDVRTLDVDGIVPSLLAAAELVDPA
ncbi:MAG: phosphoglycolate phosphatase [Burkholderiaceae bacterium]